jgi:hypothetical protein
MIINGFWDGYIFFSIWLFIVVLIYLRYKELQKV